MKNMLMLVLVAMSGLAYGQVDGRPQPFIAGGISNASTFGFAAVGGVTEQYKHFLTVDEAGYESGGKKNDNDNTSTAGHTRYLRGDAYVRFGNWFVGPGAAWSKTYTPAYSK